MMMLDTYEKDVRARVVKIFLTSLIDTELLSLKDMMEVLYDFIYCSTSECHEMREAIVEDLKYYINARGKE